MEKFDKNSCKDEAELFKALGHPTRLWIVKECACPKSTCPNHGKCCQCVIKHKNTDSLPYCLCPDNEGDKSVENYYRKLKKRLKK